MKTAFEVGKQLGSGATHVAHCNKIGPYFRHWCKVLAKVGRHCYADNETDLDAKMQRGEEAKSVSGIAAISRHSEGNSNFIPENLLLSNQEIDNSRNSRHSERQRKNPADYYNTSKLKGIHMKNFSETDHASIPLGVFASKSVSLSDWLRPTSKNLAAWLPSRLAAKKSAFTLAEVLITLGIIGVVAALTIPTIIQSYQKQVTVIKLKKAYSALGQIAQKSLADNDVVNFTEETVATQKSVKEFFDTYWLPYFNGANVDTSPSGPWQGSNIAYKYKNGRTYNVAIYTNYSAGRIFFSTPDGVTYFILLTKWGEHWTPMFNPKQEVVVDINGIKPPNVFGKDLFRFWIDFKDGIVRADLYSNTTAEINSNCNSSGTACAAKIMQDGWKITYPW